MRRKIDIPVLQRAQLVEPPRLCPKPNCRGTFFIAHEDGWQCWNCMKIIYKDLPILSDIVNTSNGTMP